MRDLYVIAGVGVIAVGIGTALFFFGPASLQSDVSSIVAQKSAHTSFVVLTQGIKASSISERSNYRVTTQTQFDALLRLIYGTNPPTLPQIDFTRSEILGVFDGTHSSGGYDIHITSIEDLNGTRTVTIDHSTPLASCHSKAGFTSPYELVQVPVTGFSLAHIDTTSTTTCP
jgi:hypothetical protein